MGNKETDRWETESKNFALYCLFRNVQNLEKSLPYRLESIFLSIIAIVQVARCRIDSVIFISFCFPNSQAFIAFISLFYFVLFRCFDCPTHKMFKDVVMNLINVDFDTFTEVIIINCWRLSQLVDLAYF